MEFMEIIINKKLLKTKCKVGCIVDFWNPYKRKVCKAIIFNQDSLYTYINFIQ